MSPLFWVLLLGNLITIGVVTGMLIVELLDR